MLASHRVLPWAEALRDEVGTRRHRGLRAVSPPLWGSRPETPFGVEGKGLKEGLEKGLSLFPRFARDCSRDTERSERAVSTLSIPPREDKKYRKPLTSPMSRAIGVYECVDNKRAVL